MNDTIFQQIKPLITVYSGSAKVDQKVASEEVLQVVTDSEIEATDDYSLQDLDSNEMRTAGSESPELEQTDDEESDSDANSVYTIISQARFNEDTEVGIRITIKKAVNTNQNDSFQTLDYQQIYQGDSLFSDEMEQFLVIAEDESE